MLVHLTGVLETGDTREPGVPDNPRIALIVTQTESVIVRMTAVYANGAPIPLLSVASILALTVRRHPEGPPIVARLGTIRPALGSNVVEFELVPVDTLPDFGVVAGQYIYDVWMTQFDGTRDALVPTSPFIVEPTVNRPNDPLSLVPPVPFAPITAAQHEALHQLIHFINSGPARGFVTGAFKETLPLGNPFPTSVIWWVSSAKTGKIVEKLITRNANKTPASITWNMYGTDGVTIVESTTEAIAYSGVFETTRTRAIA